MRRRFRDEVASTFFPRHGIELLGAFTAPDQDGRLTYMTRFADEAARKKAWASFAADPEWAAVKAASETDGPLLKNQTVSVLSPAGPRCPPGLGAPPEPPPPPLGRPQTPRETPGSSEG